MNISFLQAFRQEIFSSGQNNLFTSDQKKVAAVALVIFGCIALAYLFLCRHTLTPVIPDQESPDLENDSQTDPEFTLIKLANGQWSKTHLNGIVEQGPFEHGKLSGPGKRLYPEGESDVKEIKGLFVNGELNGKGEMLFFDGTRHTGQFLNGSLLYGTKSFPVSRSSKIEEETGNFENDQLTGHGLRRFSDGKIQEGTFQGGRLKIEVFVKGLDGKTRTLSLTDEDTIESLQKKISLLEWGIPVDNMRLLFAGRQLEDDKTLDHYNIRKESTIHLCSRLKGD